MAATTAGGDRAPPARRKSHIPTAATRNFASIARLRPRAGEKRVANQVKGENGDDWSLARSGLPDIAVGSHSGSRPERIARCTSMVQGVNWSTGSPTLMFLGWCAPRAAPQG